MRGAKKMDKEAEGLITNEVVEPIQEIQFPLTPAQLCRLIGVSRCTLRQWEKEGRFPPIPQKRQGKQWIRQIGPKELGLIFEGMEKITIFDKGMVKVPRYRWLKDFSPDRPCRITVPSHGKTPRRTFIFEPEKPGVK